LVPRYYFLWHQPRWLGCNTGYWCCYCFGKLWKCTKNSQLQKNGKAITTKGEGSTNTRAVWRYYFRMTCRVFTSSETCYRYQAKPRDDNAEIADWLLRLTTAHKPWGRWFMFFVSSKHQRL